MSTFTRIGPILARSSLLQHQRHMASVASQPSDTIQRLFLDKVKEFKTSNKGIDASQEKAISEEMARLKRVFNIDEAKLTQIDMKFQPEAEVTLRDLDEDKERRRLIASGALRKPHSEQKSSALLESIPPYWSDEFHNPPDNHPDETLLDETPPEPMKVSDESRPDYEATIERYTPEIIEDEMRVNFGKDMPTIDDDKKPERDLVNFPTLSQPLDTPPTRYHIIPESWFRFFHPKTGITGPYTFGAALTTFLLSKEIWVIEHEFLTGVSNIIVFTYIVSKVGPKITAWYRDSLKQEFDGWEKWRTGNIDALALMQDRYRENLKKDKVVDDLYAIRKMDLENQAELEYRSRINNIYSETTRRLNYLVAVANSQRQLAHKHMVDWVIKNACQSFGPKQESEVLDNCIMNLKQMSAKNANAI